MNKYKQSYNDSFQIESNSYQAAPFQNAKQYPGTIQIDEPYRKQSYNYQAAPMNLASQPEQQQQFQMPIMPINSNRESQPVKAYEQQIPTFPPQPGFRVEHKPIGENIGMSKYVPGDIKEFYNQRQQYFQQRVALTVVFCFAVLLSFYKNTTIDMIICVIFLNWSLKKELDSKKMLAITVAILILVIMEIVWLFTYSSPWWNNDNPKTDFRVESGIKIFTVIFSYFQLFAKIIALYIFGMSSYQDYHSQFGNNQKPNIQQPQDQQSYYQQEHIKPY